VSGYAENRVDFREPVTEAGKEPVGRHVRFERQGRGTVRNEKGREGYRSHEGVWIREVKKAADHTGSCMAKPLTGGSGPAGISLP
jgi:hypothetical protein